MGIKIKETNMLFSNIIHDAIQNISIAIYAVRNHFGRPDTEAQETDDRQEEFWNSVIGREISERIEEYVRQQSS